MGIVYKLTFPNGKAYIGLTTLPFEVRLKQHEYKSVKFRYNTICLAIREFGIKNVKTEILDEIDDLKALRKRETELIIEHNTIHPNGYNKSLSTGPIKGTKYITSKMIIEQMQKEKLNQFQLSF